ncbi:MAG: NGG1p interacting factor NIF3 [Patescibacteria group bacterium]
MMTIGQIYKLAIEMGIKHDPRGEKICRKRLNGLKEKYRFLPAEEKKEFDPERLVNPYSDTRVYFGDLKKPVKRMLVGIDIGTSELLLAKELSRQKPIDLVMAHHPTGLGLAGLHEVMDMQAEVLAKYGVSISAAQGLLHVKMEEVSRTVSPINHNRAIDAAKLLGLSFLSVHTPADNLVTDYIKKTLDREKRNIETIGDILKILKKIPEYQAAMKLKAGPRLFAGKEGNFAGKIALTELTGGTEGSKEIYEKMAQAGIDTVIGMHMSEEHKKEAEKSHINAIIAGHISSDSIGVNLFLDEIEKRGVEVIPCSGLIRIKRFRKRKK